MVIKAKVKYTDLAIDKCHDAEMVIEFDLDRPMLEISDEVQKVIGHGEFAIRNIAILGD